MSTVDSIINGELDLYEYLGVPHDAAPEEIRRQYRRVALVYHPDKNSSAEAADKFHVLSQIYEILSDSKLREDYNAIRRFKQDKTRRNEELDEQTKRFKEELLRSERHNAKTTFDDVNRQDERNIVAPRQLEQLKEEGLARRRDLEKRRRGLGVNNAAYVAYTDIPIDMKVRLKHRNISNKAIVRWKHRVELEGQFTVDILKDIMSVFGPVVSAQGISEPFSNYRAAVLEFEDPKDMAKALEHDYRKSAALWDGTKYRKLASLLRECVPYSTEKSTNEEVIDEAVKKVLQQDVEMITN